MTAPFNELDPATDELLTILAEECAEVVQAVCKAQRHGLDAYHPDGGPSNREQIENELGQVLAALSLLCASGVLGMHLVQQSRRDKLERIGQYLHHAKVPKRLLRER